MIYTLKTKSMITATASIQISIRVSGQMLSQVMEFTFLSPALTKRLNATSIRKKTWRGEWPQMRKDILINILSHYTGSFS